ncbi:MAG: ankyrin repeat domain-containing protein [Verrucomicrobiales bacterium]|nr:ankyrin repeat domain-containing protein [Verrucomicrobiales bacterium]
MNKRSILLMAGVALLLIILVFASLFLCGKFDIHNAARHGEIRKIKMLLWLNPDLVNSKDIYGNTPLHIAANGGSVDELALLVDYKADVNAKSNNGGTPLLFASYANRQDEAEWLLAHKADINAKNDKGETPLQKAAALNNKDMVEMLLANKADVNAKDNDGMTPLHWAAKYAKKDLVELLLTNKADINARDKNGYTPLHLAEVRKPTQYRHMSQEFLDMEKKDIADLVEFLHQHGGQE